jgi:hypothetical protein
MGTNVIRFPARRHARASSRAAKRVSKSAVTPADLALSVDKTADHHSGGIRFLADHLRTATWLAPTSEAMTSNVSQSSMMEANEFKSDMPCIMGPAVPKNKSIVSHDSISHLGQPVLMDQDDEDIAESAWREEFRERLRKAQGNRTQQVMADLLGISRERYSKYVGGRKSMMPTRLLPRFAMICDVDLLELIEGPRKEKKAVEKPPQRQRSRRA